MNDEQKPFTVTDRRHFTADGLPREEAEPLEPPRPPRPEPRARPAAPEPAAAQAQVEAQRRPAPAATEPEGPQDPAGAPAGGPEARVDFTGFVLSLASQAGAVLAGGGPEGAPPDLRAARTLIGILEMLQDKTAGRRTPDEDRVLEGVLYELRMAFLQRSGVVGA